ncbi:alpha/beta hydrolase [Ferrimonas sp. SCSIO 43195]|uniref:alpha/beta hydrolase n=1 Tax=Ferrimonas sp. SCSIO 43195 TaxID=2822844 RepID=UPI0020751736|nr:alpha/beta hydrolase [Ferrimonas sp. SCSIO 43195]
MKRNVNGMAQSLTPLLLLLWIAGAIAAPTTVIDSRRDRAIPIEVHQPVAPQQCRQSALCPVALISAGYGVSHRDYQFMVQPLINMNYLVITVGHELASDPPLAVSGNLYLQRQENWIRGAATLEFLRRSMQPDYSSFDFDHLLLIGHSNGGDLSSWLATHQGGYVKQLVTLDHRRVPLPRDPNIAVLSIRASDFAADDGVLPTTNELPSGHAIEVTTIAHARHNDMTDHGPLWLKQAITTRLERFLQPAERTYGVE